MAFSAAYDRLCARAYAAARSRFAPAIRNSQYAYRDAIRTALTGTGRWLDVGCGHDLLPEWMDDRSLDLAGWEVAGIDLDRRAIRRHRSLRWRIVGNVERLPFRSSAFDLITANMVVEHVADPLSLFAELGRVLAPGGRLIVHTPNADGYTTRLTKLLPDRLLAPLASLLLRRHAADVYPTYYRANSRHALQSAAGSGPLALRSFEFVNSSPQLVRVPPLMLVEVLAMRLMQAPARAQHRACILATFERTDGPSVPIATPREPLTTPA
jgi:SAM-dependent methyltransferase